MVEAGGGPGSTALPSRSPASLLLPVSEQGSVEAPDEQTLLALGTRAHSVVAVSLSLRKEKPVTDEKAHPADGFRQGSFAGLKCPIGRGGLAGSDGAGWAGLQPPQALETAAFIVCCEDCAVTTSQMHRPFEQGNLIPLEILAQHHRNILLK